MTPDSELCTCGHPYMTHQGIGGACMSCHDMLQRIFDDEAWLFVDVPCLMFHRRTFQPAPIIAPR